jgi:hypothetical protein
MPGITSYHVKIAAEAFAAGLFAHAGYNVLIQYGADQPTYDLVLGKGATLARISVKGTQLPGWGLAGRYVQNADYLRAADAWLRRQGQDLIFCFVSFYKIPLGKCPDCFLATAQGIACQLKRQCGGRGHGSLSLKREISRGAGAGSTDEVPQEWRFSATRATALIGV